MDEQLHNFTPLSIMHNVNTLAYLNTLQNSRAMYKGEPTTIVSILCQTRLLKKTCTQVARVEVTYPNQKKIQCIAKLTIQQF